MALPGDQKCIAVVDDDEPVRRALARLLRSAGFAVETFACGVEFLESIVGPRGPDCLVLDLNMPGMDGLEVLARLTASGRRVPVVVVSAVETEGMRVRSVMAGHPPAFGSRSLTGNCSTPSLPRYAHPRIRTPRCRS